MSLSSPPHPRHCISTAGDTTVTEIPERRLFEKVHILSFFRCRTSKKIVEYVEVPLARGGTRYAIALEIVIECLDAA